MRRSDKKQDNRENMLKQGISIIMEQGYHGTGLQEILDATQVPKGSFYNYFGSKENYVAEVIQHYIDPFITRLKDHLQRSDNDALSAIQGYFDELIDDLERNQYVGGCLLGNLIGEISDTSNICQASLQAAVNRYRDTLQSGLIKAQQQGTIRSDMSAGDMADLFMNAWQGALLRAKIEKSSAPVRQCCHNLLTDFFKQ